MNKRFYYLYVLFVMSSCGIVAMEQDLGSGFVAIADDFNSMVISSSSIKTPSKEGVDSADVLGSGGDHIAINFSQIDPDSKDSAMDITVTPVKTSVADETHSAKKRKLAILRSSFVGKSPIIGKTPGRQEAIEILSSMDNTPGDSKGFLGEAVALSFAEEAFKRSRGKKRSLESLFSEEESSSIDSHNKFYKVIKSNNENVLKVVSDIHQVSEVSGEEVLTPIRVADLEHIDNFSKKKGGGHNFDTYEEGSLAGPAFVSFDDKVILAKGINRSKDRKILQKDFSGEKIIEAIRTDPIAIITPHKNMHQCSDGTIVGAIKDRVAKIGYRSVFPLITVSSVDDTPVLLGRLSAIAPDHAIQNLQDVVVSKDEYNVLLQRGTSLTPTKKSPVTVIDISKPVRDKFGNLFSQHGVSAPTIYAITPKP